MSAEIRRQNVLFVLVVVASWFAITEFFPVLVRIWGRPKVPGDVLAAARMFCLFLVTWAYVRFYERRSFSSGFNFNFQRLGDRLLWAAVFAVLTVAVEAAYQFLIVMPLTRKVVEASAGAPSEAITPLWARLTTYIYVVFEGVIEVLIFVGFLFDRLAEKWGWAAGLVVSNSAFALWHYSYWRNGWLEGSLMVLLTFIVGVGVSLSYLKTRNSLSPVVCHFLVDLPSEIKDLLGIVH